VPGPGTETAGPAAVGQTVSAMSDWPADGEEDVPISEPDRYELQHAYLELCRVRLPAQARRQGWSLRDDHCFMRIILDHLFGDCWYHHLDQRLTAYKQLNVNQLTQAVGLAEQLLRQGQPLLAKMNASSLRWRGK
jgi:hypothetical protein